LESARTNPVLSLRQEQNLKTTNVVPRSGISTINQIPLVLWVRFSPIVFEFFGAYPDEGAQNRTSNSHAGEKTMTRTSAIYFGSVAAYKGGRTASVHLVRSSQLKKTVSMMMTFILCLLLIPAAQVDLHAEIPIPVYVALNADQLDQLVAPIALYPDPMVAQILTASTLPDQIAAAEHWSNDNIGLSADQRAADADSMSWDPAVKGLIAFPAVLDNLAKNRAWTGQLGNAYYNQPTDVMNAIQAMRIEAQQSDVLVTTPQQRVVVEAAGLIDIVPANPAVVYVPYYNPWLVWGTLFAAYPGYVVASPPVGVIGVAAGVGVAFEPPVAVAAFAGFSWGFSAWAPGWTTGTVLFNHSTYISESTTVVNHGFFGGHDCGAFEHGGHGVPKGYRACARKGAARAAADRAKYTKGYGSHAKSGYGHSSSGYSPGKHSEAHNGYSGGSNGHTNTRNSYASRMDNHSQGHSSYSQGKKSHTNARNNYASGTSNQSQARSRARQSQARSHAGQSQARNRNAGMGGRNRGRTPRSTSGSNRPTTRTVANRQRSGGSTGGHAGGTRRQ
jgi:hypothetical protein